MVRVSLAIGAVARSLLALSAATALSGCGDLLASRPIDAVVVEAASGKPLADVAVLVVWRTELGTTKGTYAGKYVRVAEARTDRDGRFHVAAWGPVVDDKGGFAADSPRIVLFKSGYEYRELKNDGAAADHSTWYRLSSWSGQRIELKPFTQGIEHYAAHLTGLSSALEGPAGMLTGTCDWRLMPRMLKALDRQDTEFKLARARPLTLAATLRAADAYFTQMGCGPVAEALQ